MLDDEDPSCLRDELDLGPANRGLHCPIHKNTDLSVWPSYVRDHLHLENGITGSLEPIVDDLIYLYGSTCADEVGLSMTMGHELQHAIQRDQFCELWVVNSVASRIAPLNLWCDIPIEVEARIMSKRMAQVIFGEERVEAYIRRKIDQNVTAEDVSDWKFVRSLGPFSSIDLAAETKRLFARLKNRRAEVETKCREGRWDVDFGKIDLDAYFH